MVHMFLSKIFSIFTKRAREPNFCESNLCEPSSHIFRWTLYYGSNFSKVHKFPVNRWTMVHKLSQRPTFLFFNKIKLKILVKDWRFLKILIVDEPLRKAANHCKRRKDIRYRLPPFRGYFIFIFINKAPIKWPFNL